MKKLIDKLFNERNLSDDELKTLISQMPEPEYLYEKARIRAKENYGNKVFIRGLIEVSNYCKNDCYYCGIRKSNKAAERYRLTDEEILSACENGYHLGFRTFVMQGGEDVKFSDDRLVNLIKTIKSKHPDCAVTLSLGEKSDESYKKLRAAGADRYLLRHETACEAHYRSLHPTGMSYQNRMRCLKTLKKIGFQTGCGFMVGSPGQTVENIVSDLRFIKEFEPQMVGIGPFLPHKDTPFGEEKKGSAELTVYLLAIIRLMLPSVLLPATTALGTASENGREKGILAGANVIMPNLSPKEAREKYTLYNNKLHTGTENAFQLERLKEQILKIGYEIVCDRGDYNEK
ncbi:MAG: [Clostridia bacterium]|nr:[FeFe] hydrogenase H-cluster radical SAM maturase HydE [Clostridia bacterium]